MRRFSQTQDIFVRSAALLVCGLLSACNGSGNAQTVGDGGPDAVGTCYQPQAASAVVPECAAASLCLTSPQSLEVDSAHCPSKTSCAWTYQVDVGDTLTYQDDEIWLFLRFGGSIGGATTTEQLLAASPEVTFVQTFPARGSSGLTASYNEQKTGVSAFDTFALADGHLHVKVSYTIQTPSSQIRSQSSLCNEGDVSGICFCTYDGVDVPGSIDVDLPVEVPLP